MQFDIIILDRASGREVRHCRGPTAEGACPDIDIGEVIPCAGCNLIPAGVLGARPYTVSRQMTLCPATVAQALAVPSDTALFLA